MKTLRERFTDALIARGERQVPSRSGKYLTFTRAEGGFWFVGASGALRYGKSSTVSYPATDWFKEKLLGAVKSEAEQVLKDLGL